MSKPFCLIYTDVISMAVLIYMLILLAEFYDENDIPTKTIASWISTYLKLLTISMMFVLCLGYFK